MLHKAIIIFILCLFNLNSFSQDKKYGTPINAQNDSIILANYAQSLPVQQINTSNTPYYFALATAFMNSYEYDKAEKMFKNMASSQLPIISKVFHNGYSIEEIEFPIDTIGSITHDYMKLLGNSYQFTFKEAAYEKLCEINLVRENHQLALYYLDKTDSIDKLQAYTCGMYYISDNIRFFYLRNLCLEGLGKSNEAIQFLIDYAHEIPAVEELARMLKNKYPQTEIKQELAEAMTSSIDIENGTTELFGFELDIHRITYRYSKEKTLESFQDSFRSSHLYYYLSN